MLLIPTSIMICGDLFQLPFMLCILVFFIIFSFVIFYIFHCFSYATIRAGRRNISAMCRNYLSFAIAKPKRKFVPIKNGEMRYTSFQKRKFCRSLNSSQNQNVGSNLGFRQQFGISVTDCHL